MTNKLTNKQRAFVEHYLTSWNATEAARLAGYGRKKTRENLSAIASETLANPKVKSHIERRLSEKVMAADEVLARLSFMATGFDPADYMEMVEVEAVDDEGDRYITGLQVKLDLLKLQRDGFSRLIKSVKNTRAGPVFEFYDQQSSLKLVGEGHGIFDSGKEQPLPLNIKVTIGKPDE